MLTLDNTWIRTRVRLDREVMDPESLAAALEHRLHTPDIDHGALQQGCDYAADAGLATVLCRPEHIATAARHLTGTGTAAVTALAFHDSDPQPHDPGALATETMQLLSAGAAEVALIIAPGRENACLHMIGEQLDAVIGTATPHGGKVRVLIDTSEATKDEMTACTAMVGTSGAALVQGGSFRGDRATFSQIEAMRSTLPFPVLLKWTQPIRSVEMMLVCMALGVNRFNGDIPTLLAEARRSSQYAPLMLPIHGVDF